MKSVFLLPLMGWFCASPLLAGALAVKSGTVVFNAKATPGFLSIEGTGGQAEGKLARDGKKVTGELRSKLDGFTTGMDLRDEHMKEKYLDTKKFPEAVLKLTEFEVDDKGEADKKAFKGLLTLHGVEKPVAGEASMKKTGDSDFEVSAEMTISMKEFGFDVPNYKAVVVKDPVVIAVNLKLKEEAAAAAAATPAPAAPTPAAKDSGKAAPKAAPKDAGKK